MSHAPKLLLVACLAVLAMSCSPKHDNTQQQNATENQDARTFESGPGGLRGACGDDIRKYCANDPHKRRCLRDNMDKISSACKTAVSAPRNAEGGHRQGIGRLCSDDIQKFCANDPRKFRCLKDNLGQLSEGCKAAVTAPRDNGPAGTP